MPTLLACTDGSVYANSVYQHAAWAAQRLDAAVHVLHMLDPHHEDPVKVNHSGHIGLGVRSALLAEIVELEAARAKLARKQGEAILEDAVARLRSAGIQEVHAEQKHGRISDSIETCQQAAELVVIGKRGTHADFARGHLGHNLERVVRSCTHPVLVAAREFKPISRFVLAFDGRDAALKALTYAAEQPLLKGLPCHLLCVGKNTPALETAISQATDQLSRAGFEVTAEILPGEPEAVIAETVTKTDSDLLVMGAYAHSQIRQMIVGSTTSAMIRSVKIPLLLFS